MPDHPPNSLISMPVELITDIASRLPKFSLLRLRSVDRQLNLVTIPLAFRSLTLRPYENSPVYFALIAKTKSLGCHVKELTVDTHILIDPGLSNIVDLKQIMCKDFISVLPCVRFLANLKTLHLRFSHDLTTDLNAYGRDHSLHVRFVIIDTISKCLVGTWTPPAFWRSPEFQRLVCRPGNLTTSAVPPWSRRDPIPITSLTISNLVECVAGRLRDSRALKELLASEALVDLRLLFTDNQKASLIFRGYDQKFYGEIYMLQSLQTAWLSLPVASHLAVLSLYYQEYWGWNPDIDFRTLKLPALKVLALGNYVFSQS